ncbi:conserved hypothetical protein [Candidatus Terasakiella magnetica]|nr:conserved hypothetical protein [Candidatus Terasakiella magnetica]
MSIASETIWRRLAQSLKSMLETESPKAAAAPKVGSASVMRPPPRKSIEQAADALQEMLERDPSLKAKLHIISLCEYRDTVAEKWDRLADKVAIIVEQVIRRNIGSGNPFCRDGEDSWVLAFPHVPPEEARRRTLVIVEHLGRYLFGEQVAGRVRPVALATEVSVSDAVSGDGMLRSARIRDAVEETRAFVPCPSAVAPRCDPAPVPSADESMSGWQSLAPTEKAKDRSSDWEVMETKAPKPPAFIDADPNAIGALPPGAHLSLMWRPTWVAAGEAISAYGARIARMDRDGAEPIEGCRAYPEGDVKTALTLDRYVVSTAVRDIIAASRSGDAAMEQSSVIIPLSWYSLSSDQRGGVIIPLSNLTQATRNNRLVLEIFHVPDGTSTPELESVVSFAKSLCREVLVRTRMSARRSSLAADIGVSMVGLDLSELRPDERMDDDELLAALERVHEATTRDGIGCYLWGARHRRVVGGVVQNGFEMVNGPGLMKDIGRPAIVLPAPRARFIAA